MLINKQIPALYNGVSQQPPTVRLPSQAEAMVNFYPTVVDGLRRRPPTEHLAKLSSSDLSGAYIHTINRDTTERYIVVLTDGDLKVYDLDGVEKTVAFPGRQPWVASTAYSTVGHTVRPTVANGYLYRVVTAGTSAASQPTWPTALGDTVTDGTVTWQCVPDYLNVGNAKTDFACVTVADFTFIVNKTVQVAMGEAGYDTYTPADGLFSIVESKKKKGIRGMLQAVAALQQQQAVRAQYAANGLGVLKGTKQTIQDIPSSPAPVDGDVWKIQGTADSGFATYYVRRNGGVWDETIAPNIANRILECTMPHALVRLQDGTFEFQQFSWAPRRVGDETTNPNPGFIGRTIRDVFFYKNRLGFAVDEGVVFSRAGDFGNFYRLTVLDLLDDEAITVNASETKVTLINHAVPFPTGMMLFADQVQFRLNHGDVLTPTSVGLDVTTQYEMVKGARPYPLGSDLYFASEDGDWGRVWEYYVRDDSNNSDAADTTGHVPRYVPAGIFRLAGSSGHDALFVLTSGAPSRVYAYKFYWANENEKAQSAWGYWQFASDVSVLAIDVLDNYVYLVVQRADGAYLERAAMESGAEAPGLDFQVFLDRRASVTGVWLAGEGKTEFTLPYPVAEAVRPQFRIVRGAAFSTATGAVLSVDPSDYEWTSATTVKVAGNFSAGPSFVGLVFESRYTFSPQFMKNTQDVPIVTGRLTLSGYTVYFTGTAYFATEVAPYGVAPDVEEVIPSRLSEFDGKTLGKADLVLGSPVFTEGSYTAQVYGDARVARVSLVNDSPYGSTFTQAEWTGIYHNVARTI